MALIYTARLDPDKPEWIRRRLVAHGLPADVTAEKVGSYRFDDPAGEIGVESMLVRVGDQPRAPPCAPRTRTGAAAGPPSP